tara:strand:+ start:1009 stop:2055 length:1047 start_codon:yes stop_codon:yes gene_type:complete
MSGWEALAGDNLSHKHNEIKGGKTVVPEVVKEEKTVEKVVEEVEEKIIISSSDFMSQFPAIATEMEAQSSEPASMPSHIFCGVVGHEGTGKSGLVFDAHMNRYPEGILMSIDFDNGALACKQAHYNSHPNLRVFSPWVMQDQDRTAYNYIASYQRVMDLCKYAVEYAEHQHDEGFEGLPLKTFLVTGVDQFDSMCIDCMKIYDLDMDAKDAIEASQSKLNAEIGWNWSIRATRFKQLTAMCQKLNRLGVDVYWETHLKEDKDGKLGFDGWKFAWHGSANKDLFQIIWCHSKPIRNNDGSLTGETRYFAEFFKEKTNSNLMGQERAYFVIKKGEPAEWYGLPELRDGML